MKDLFKEGYLIVPTEDLIAFREDVLRFVDLNSYSKKWFTTYDWVNWEIDILYHKKLGYIPDSVCFKIKGVRKYDIRVQEYAPKGVGTLPEVPFSKEQCYFSSRIFRLYHFVVPKRLNGEVVEVYRRGKRRYREDILLGFYRSCYEDFYKPLHKELSNHLSYKDFLKLSINITKEEIVFFSGDTLFLGIKNSGVVFDTWGQCITSISVDRFEYFLHKLFSEYLGLEKPTKNGVKVNLLREVRHNPRVGV